jgi:hypothetical protein
MFPNLDARSLHRKLLIASRLQLRLTRIKKNSMRMALLSANEPEIQRSYSLISAASVKSIPSVPLAKLLLPTKNEPLNTQGRLRTLLILNGGIFPNEERDVREYFSTRNLEEFPNVDRVFFEITPGNIALVFDRRVFDSYRDERLPEDDELGCLFPLFVEHRLASDETKAFRIVRKINEKYGNLNRLSAHGKDALISCGERFAREEDCPLSFGLSND